MWRPGPSAACSEGHGVQRGVWLYLSPDGLRMPYSGVKRAHPRARADPVVDVELRGRGAAVLGGARARRAELGGLSLRQPLRPADECHHRALWLPQLCTEGCDDVLEAADAPNEFKGVDVIYVEVVILFDGNSDYFDISK